MTILIAIFLVISMVALAIFFASAFTRKNKTPAPTPVPNPDRDPQTFMNRPYSSGYYVGQPDAYLEDLARERRLRELREEEFLYGIPTPVVIVEQPQTIMTDEPVPGAVGFAGFGGGDSGGAGASADWGSSDSGGYDSGSSDSGSCDAGGGDS